MALSESEELEYLQLKKRKNSAIASDVAQNTGIANRIGQGLKKAAEIPYAAGGKVADVMSSMGAPPELAGGLGYGTNVALQSIPMLVGGKGAKAVGRAAAIPMRKIAEWLMGSALKPTIKQHVSGDAATAIDTMLEQGINATKGGTEKLQAKISELNDEIKDRIANSSATINKGKVGISLQDTFDKFKNQVNPQGDLDAIRKAWSDFRNHPDLKGKMDIPVQKAQEMKQGTYKILSKKYGQVGTAETEAQKGLARGLKEGIANAVPEIAGLNAQETALIKTLGVVERRALMDLNKNPGGLAWLAGNPASFAAFMADKSALFKSLAARLINSASKNAPGVAANTARSGIALSEIYNQVGRQPEMTSY